MEQNNNKEKLEETTASSENTVHTPNSTHVENEPFENAVVQPSSSSNQQSVRRVSLDTTVYFYKDLKLFGWM